MLIANDPENYPAVQFRIARPTSNLNGVIEFYSVGLGLPILYRFKEHDGYSGVMIGLPGIQYHLEFTQDQKGTTGTAPTNDNLLVFYFSQKDAMDIVLSRLARLNYDPVEPENLYWKNKGVTYSDPGGWRVVLHHGLFLTE